VRKGIDYVGIASGDHAGEGSRESGTDDRHDHQRLNEHGADRDGPLFQIDGGNIRNE
jgi:hypothetical protein